MRKKTPTALIVIYALENVLLSLHVSIIANHRKILSQRKVEIQFKLQIGICLDQSKAFEEQKKKRAKPLENAED